MADHAIIPPLMTSSGFTLEERGMPKDQIGELAGLDRTHFVRDPMRDGWVDGELGHVAPDTQVIAASFFAGQAPRWRFIFIGCLPGADDDLAGSAPWPANRRTSC